MRFVIALTLFGLLSVGVSGYRRRARHVSLTEAQRRGMETTRVRRELISGREYRIEEAYWLRSEMVLPFEGRYTWKLLQRPGSYHPALPDGWYVEGLPNPLP